jgi:hypothetical protein
MGMGRERRNRTWARGVAVGEGRTHDWWAEIASVIGGGRTEAEHAVAQGAYCTRRQTDRPKFLSHQKMFTFYSFF